MKRCVMLCLVAVLMTTSLPGTAATVPELDQQMVALADVIVAGTVVSVTPTVASDTADAVIRVDRVVFGEPDDMAVTVRIPYSIAASALPLNAGGVMLQPGQQNLFILKRGPGGYALVNGPLGIRPLTNAQALAELAQSEHTVTVDALGPVGPFYFGQFAAVRVRVKNNGTTPLRPSSFSIEGFFISDRFGAEAPLAIKADGKPDYSSMSARALTLDGQPLADGQKDPPLLRPGENYERTVLVTCQVPNGWQVYGPDSYIQTPVQLRMVVNMQPPVNMDALAKTQVGYPACSVWMRAYVGYPYPSENSVPVRTEKSQDK